jgi:hypothetical protein
MLQSNSEAIEQISLVQRMQFIQQECIDKSHTESEKPVQYVTFQEEETSS